MGKQHRKRHGGILPKWADYLSQILVLYSIVIFTLESEPGLNNEKFFYYSELVITSLFVVEYIARLTLASNKWRYFTSFYGIVDLLATAPVLLTFGFVDLRFARIIRLLRLLRLLKFVRYTEATEVMTDALRMIKGEMTIFLFCFGSLVYTASVGIHLFEGEAQPEAFGSIMRSMWWAVVTLTTVGYGDTYPITAAGKLFTVLIVFVGIGIVAIPSGLFASALTKAHRLNDSKRASVSDQDPETEDVPQAS